mmetsp:Transcript_4731/g.10102  ORF Transcript_4731/g.10102 Transcript_4731/m.10102 type:complete len:220 (-) Transcript_4731:847-1506(-)
MNLPVILTHHRAQNRPELPTGAAAFADVLDHNRPVTLMIQLPQRKTASMTRLLRVKVLLGVAHPRRFVFNTTAVTAAARFTSFLIPFAEHVLLMILNSIPVFRQESFRRQRRHATRSRRGDCLPPISILHVARREHAADTRLDRSLLHLNVPRVVQLERRVAEQRRVWRVPDRVKHAGACDLLKRARLAIHQPHRCQWRRVRLGCVAKLLLLIIGSSIF